MFGCLIFDSNIISRKTAIFSRAMPTISSDTPRMDLKYAVVCLSASHFSNENLYHRHIIKQSRHSMVNGQWSMVNGQCTAPMSSERYILLQCKTLVVSNSPRLPDLAFVRCTTALKFLVVCQSKHSARQIPLAQIPRYWSQATNCIIPEYACTSVVSLQNHEVNELTMPTIEGDAEPDAVATAASFAAAIAACSCCCF
jgi:hypothetical protein